MSDLSITLTKGDASFTYPFSEIDQLEISLDLGGSLQCRGKEKFLEGDSGREIIVGDTGIKFLVGEELRGPILRISHQLGGLDIYQLLECLRKMRGQYAFVAEHEDLVTDNPYEAYLLTQYIDFWSVRGSIVNSLEIHEHPNIHIYNPKDSKRHYIRCLFPGILTLDLIEELLQSQPMTTVEISRVEGILRVDFAELNALSRFSLLVVTMIDRYARYTMQNAHKSALK